MLHGGAAGHKGHDGGDVHPLSQAVYHRGDDEEFQPGDHRDRRQGRRVEKEGRLDQVLLAEPGRQPSSLGGGDPRGHRHGGHDEADGQGGRAEAPGRQQREEGQQGAVEDDEGGDTDQEDPHHLPVAQDLPRSHQVFGHALTALRLRVFQQVEDHEGHRQRQQGQEEGVVPAEHGQGSTDGRVAGGAHRQDAGVVPHGLGPLPARVKITDHGTGEGCQGRGPCALEEPEGQQQVEAPGQAAGGSGQAEQEQGGDQDPLPAEPVGHHPQEGRQQDAREGEHRDQHPHLTGGDAEIGDDPGKGRGHAGHAQHPHEGDPEHDLEVPVAVESGAGFPSGRPRLVRQCVPLMLKVPSRETDPSLLHLSKACQGETGPFFHPVLPIFCAHTESAALNLCPSNHPCHPPAVISKAAPNEGVVPTN